MAQRIPQHVIDEVREKTNIVEVIGQYVQLKKSGKNYLGLCPFHEEKTPSFSVAEDKQIFHCFGCGKGGNVYTFLQELEGISFPEAVKKVADLEQIPLGIEISNEPISQTSTGQQQLIALHERTRDLYHHLLVNTKVGETALSYLHERGLSDELINEFKIGFAPSQRDFLVQIAQQDKVSADLMERSGLFIRREDGSFSDRFYQRVMFPLNDFRGKPIGFSGRILKTEEYPGDDQPKYLNSPETELFNKRQVLFNFDKARNEIRKQGEAILFEGFMDVLAAWQADIKIGLASMGTSLTEQQIASIERITGQVVISYDGDDPGQAATDRALSILDAHSRLGLSVVTVPEKLDPDEYLRKYGVTELQNLLQHGRQTPFAFKMHYRKKGLNLENEADRLNYLDVVMQDLAKVQSPVEQDLYLGQLANDFHLTRESLKQQLQMVRQTIRTERRQQQTVPSPAPVQSVRRVVTKEEKAERMLLYRSMNESSVREQLVQTDFQFIHDHYQELLLYLDSYMMVHGNFILADFLNYLKENEMKQLAIDISMISMSEDSNEREIYDLMRVISQSGIAEEIKQRRKEQLEARKSGNQQRELELTIQIIELTKRLKQA
ncbi:DNA primase [Enterococcus gilvus]|uniref:DNA primase n=1 Tax=Enterococcus gilvus ATCC BAA-350 TaxID=1158614 RepID=R2XZC6_9ENTE|nr:DNA primase [Enterococcus gilvus]EOI55397.1 DNA primase [Enterococcus gilvus ATCC BAA-350]EOW82060.1 DNA primase [Enterococcus gilvus ATCC BAA-350]MBS5820937.1 DNA primase [Enterococcus gilvus]OJG43089.1 DNA primase [Enterococcus gilvus]